MAELKISKRGKIDRPPLTEEAITAAIELGSNPESADYLVKAGTRANLPKELISKFEEIRDYVNLERAPNDKLWSGIPSDSDFKNMQKNLAAKTASQYGEIQGALKIGVALNEQSKLAYGFKSEDTLNKNIRPLIETLIKSFLSQNQLILKGETIFETTEKGRIIYEDDEAKKADPKRVEQLLTDKKNGLSAFMENMGIKVESVKARAYPEHKAAAELQRREETVVRNEPEETPSESPKSRM